MDGAFDYRGKTVFVAGGSSGINLGIAEGFARAGAAVAIASRSKSRVDAAAAALRAHGGEVMGETADVRDYAAVAAVLEKVSAALGPIDALVSGAAGNFPAPALGMSANGFKAVVDIDLLGTFNVLRAAHAHLRKPGAAIINISAPQAFNPSPLQVHVCAAKAGVDMVTRVLAMEWGGDGIRVNSIVPGPIEGTEGVRRLMPSAAARRAVERSIPLRRLGQTEDVARLALFLASPLASYVTGAVIPVDGGWSLAGIGSISAMAAQGG
ncbi:MAG TPA: SDR family oxidoreductase [Stellaceae bacterium]|nr:SDR family oxidoreductase [Stellaceae bacterium]